MTKLSLSDLARLAVIATVLTIGLLAIAAATDSMGLSTFDVRTPHLAILFS